MDLIRFEKTALLYRNLKDFVLDFRSLSCDCDQTNKDMMLGFVPRESNFNFANLQFF